MLLAASVGVTIVLFSLGLPFFFVFLFIPLIPFFQRERRVKRCPVCSYTTADERTAFCPYDGSRLELADTDHGE
ncbi:MAG: hypothetical protein HGA55_07560 [Methanoregulaceae archaeon]|nr:hypothetical protein [Methanoregulaceae archaeon]